MLRLAVLTLIGVAACGALPASRRALNYDPSYERCSWWSNEENSGPPTWSTGVCKTGKQQSPIDLCGAQGLGQTSSAIGGAVISDENLEFGLGIAKTQTVPVSKSLLTFSGLEDMTTSDDYIVEKVGRLPLGNPKTTWKLMEGRFRWGRNDQEGAEHYIEGKQYPLELQLVHINSKYSSVAEAAGKKDGILVLAQMFEINSKQVESTSLKNIAAAGSTASVKVSELINLRQLKTGTTEGLGFYAYAGSFTVPDCEESATWIVAAKPLKVSVDTLSKLRKSAGSKKEKFGNFRNLQALQGRTVYRSTSVTSNPCNDRGLPRQPDFGCKDGRVAAWTIALAILFGLSVIAIIALLIFCRRPPAQVVTVEKVVEKIVQQDPPYVAPAVMAPADVLYESGYDGYDYGPGYSSYSAPIPHGVGGRGLIRH